MLSDLAMILRPARSSDVEALLDVQQPAAIEGLGHIFPQDQHPFPRTVVADRWLTEIADPEVDGLRRFLCFEPRGHADMYGGFLVPPDDDAADLGVLFWHKDGFSTACGHGTIALGAWAVADRRMAPISSCRMRSSSWVTGQRMPMAPGGITPRRPAS